MMRRNFFIVSVFLVFTLAFSGMVFGQRVIDLDKVWGDMRVLGDVPGQASGHALAYGDINGDGYQDIIIGAFLETYVIFGSGSPPDTIDLNSQSADITIYRYNDTGCAVSSGDVNGDGYDDIIIGDLMADPIGGTNAGTTYVIFGSIFPSPPYIIDLRTQPADITIYGDNAWDQSGFSVASGDINNDGFYDVIIGAWRADSPGGEDAGKTYVILGDSFLSPPYTVDLDTQLADINVYGDNRDDELGFAVASGDINNDSYDDIIIGAREADPVERSNAGKTYVIFGSNFPSPPYTIDLNIQSADIVICGENAGDWSGSEVSTGDINNDGYYDIIIGAILADSPDHFWMGGVYVVFGDSFASPPYVINLPADITIYGEYFWGYFGHAIASGDINGDGYDDIIVSNDAGVSYGITYVVFGSNSSPLTIDLSIQPADITVFDDGISSGLTSCDLNGDSYYDLIIGAPYADPAGGIDAGETYVILGGGAIITSHGLDGNNYIKEFSLLGRNWDSFKAFGAVNSQGEVHLAVGDVDGDRLDEIVAGHGEGGKSWVKSFEMDGTFISILKAFGAANANGEVHLAIGNFDTDTADKEIAVAQGEGGQSWVKLFEADGTLILSFKTFGADNAQGEVHLASGDLNKDGIDEIIAGMGEGGSSWVKVFNLWGDFIRSFQAFDSTENPGGEVHLAVGNFDADPAVEIAAATGYNGSNKVKLFDKNGAFIREFTVFWYGGNPNGEVHLSAADMDNDGIDEIICGHGEGGSSSVWVCKADGTRILHFKAFGGVNAQGEVHLGKSNY